MTSIRLTRWLADDTKAAKIKAFTNDSTFIEAVDLLKSLSLPPIPQGVGATEAAALGLAYQNGIEDAFRKLEDLGGLTRENLDRDRNNAQTRPAPWSHITEEKSVFAPEKSK